MRAISNTPLAILQYLCNGKSQNKAEIAQFLQNFEGITIEHFHSAKKVFCEDLKLANRKDWKKFQSKQRYIQQFVDEFRDDKFQLGDIEFNVPWQELGRRRDCKVLVDTHCTVRCRRRSSCGCRRDRHEGLVVIVAIWRRRDLRST